MQLESIFYCIFFQVCQFNDEGVKLGKAYEYRVIAENEGGESAPSPVSDVLKPKPLRGH